jgi:hypothetical protein
MTEQERAGLERVLGAWMLRAIERVERENARKGKGQSRAARRRRAKAKAVKS